MAPAAPLDTLNKVIGALLLGAFVNSMLYMLEILEVIKYFRRFPNDTKTLKCSIVALLLLDSTCTFAQWACLYLYGVLHWGDLDYLGYQNLVIPIYIYTSGIIGFIVQNFLISRYFKLTKRWIVCAGLNFMTFAAVVGSVWCATQLSIVTNYSDRNVAVKSAILWLVSSAASDTAIASALVIQLRSVTSAFRETKSVIRRLIFHTIQTGSATTAIAICVLALKEGDSHSGGLSHTPNNEISLHGITVHRTAIVHIDEEQAPSHHEIDDKRPPAYGGPFDGYDKSTSEVDSAPAK
ncbi:hypothetical protein K438DRAFT_1958143 [Mycena galopus ATCC 62051]|nr:hypothetical protein K438DRAFT_1958143 [Mycena galopus ATCC 62051]